jgi:DNA-binding MarR family transcriptional regulator
VATRQAAERREALVTEIEELFQQLTWRGRQHFAGRAGQVGLTPPQFLALRTIERLGPNVTMSEVAADLHLPASSLTSIVDRLVSAGLVERGVLPNDRRTVAATITGAGRDVVAVVAAARHEDLGAMLADVADEELTEFASVLERLLAGIERAALEPPQ